MPQIIGQTSIGQTVPVEILRTYTGWALCRPLEPLPNLDAETYLPTGHALLHLSSRRLWVSVFKTTFEQPEVDFEPFIDWMVARGVQPAESWVSIRRLGDTEVPPPKTRSRKGLTPPSLAKTLAEGKGWTPGKIINPETGQREWIGTAEHQGQRRRQIIEPGTRKRKQPVGPIEQQVDATPPQETTPMTEQPVISSSGPSRQVQRLGQIARKRFEAIGSPLVTDTGIIPADNTTLFVCSGMQQFKPRFRNPDGGRAATLQSCVRTNDLELVGDGSHLTYFQMLGSFSFGNNDYAAYVDMWQAILSDLGLLKRCVVHYHPDRPDMQKLWRIPAVPDSECVWSDGEVGGHCCELYVGDLEIGNLVKPLEHSVDVGFGYERLVQVLEGKQRVDETSLFDQTLHPVVRDHLRTVQVLAENGIRPGNKGREYVMRRLLRRMLRHSPPLNELMVQEQEALERRLASAKRAWRRNSQQPPRWWWDTFGILPEEIPLLQQKSLRVALWHSKAKPADVQEGQTWTSNGRHYQLINGVGVRIAKPGVAQEQEQQSRPQTQETTPMTQISRRADLDRQMAERLGISRVKAREILSHAIEVLQEQLPDMPRIAQSLVFAWKEARTPAERAPLERAMRGIGLAPIAAAGDAVDFSGSEHISEEPVFAGDPVVVVEPGWRLAPPHATYLVTKAVVRPAVSQASPPPTPAYRDQVERAISRGVRKAEAQREEADDNAPPLIPLDVSEPTYIIRMGMRAAAPDEDTIAKMTQAWQELLPDADLELKAHEVEGLIRQALRLEGEAARRRWLNDVVYRLRKQRTEVAPRVTKDGWRQYPAGHTFVSWDVGRIVLASDPNVILYPPLVVNRSQHGSVPVHTGVTIQPGDTDQEAITRALERLQGMPQLKGRALSELQLQVQPDR